MYDVLRLGLNGRKQLHQQWVVQSHRIHIDKSTADKDKWSTYDQQWFKSFTSNKSLHLNGDEHINAILENNKNWVRDKNDKDPSFFSKLGIDIPCSACTQSLIHIL